MNALVPPHFWVLGLAGLGICVVVGLISGFRARPPAEQLSAWLDAQLSAGGLLMADSAEWPLEVTRSLAPRWKGRLPILLFLASLSFFVLCEKIPRHRLVFLDDATDTFEIEEVVSQVERKVDLLEELEFIEEEQAQEWSALVRTLRDESDSKDPAATWETLDQLSERIEDSTAVALETRSWEIAKREELIAALKAALQAYDDNRDQADAAMKELSDLLAQAAKENPNLEKLLESMSEMGMQQLAASALSPEMAKELAERLSKMTQEDLERMQQLMQQGLGSPQMCEAPGSDESLRKFLEENPGCTNLMACAGMSPDCEWGIKRGPGVAPISWLGESSEEGADFVERMVSSEKIDSLSQSQLTGESYSAPEVDSAAAGSTGGILEGKRAGNSAATTHSILPQHRAAVDRFFKRDNEE